MACLLWCFGFKDCSMRNSFQFSRFFWWKKREPAVPRNQYTCLVSSKEKATPSKTTKEEVFQEKFYGGDCVHEQRPEAKLRKNYGVILDNHVEFHKPSYQHYVASDTYKKLNWDQQFDENSQPPSKVPEISTVQDKKSKSCLLEDHDDESIKTLFFEEVMSPQIENQMQPHIGDSPYPTPLNLVDGMQTPGTIYPPKSKIYRARMLKAQFVYPISDLSKSTFGLKVGGDDSENTEKIYDSPNADRLIVGAIASHWDEEVPSRFSATSCDSNEIPSSAAKYYEDLKVSWNDTPFSLSDEKVLPQKKLDEKILIELKD